MPGSPLTPVVLTGSFVELQPLALDHVDGIAAAYVAGTMDQFRRNPDLPEPDGLDAAHAFVVASIARRDAGIAAAFAVIDQASGRVVGHTSYLNPHLDVPRVEIGSTWYAVAARGSYVNPAAKLLLLAHAFDELECRVVTILTGTHNERSQRAIERLGARHDGVLRRDCFQRDGTLRDILRSGLDRYFCLLRADPEHEKAMFELAHYAMRTPGLEHLARRQYEGYRALATSALEAAAAASGTRWSQPIELVANRLVVYTDGVTLTWLASRDDTTAEFALDCAADALSTLAVSS